jgi:MFS transporter, putative metabolite:H+ symporter
MSVEKVEYPLDKFDSTKDRGKRWQFSFYFREDKYQILKRLLLLTSVWSLILVPINASSLLVVTYVGYGHTISKSIEITTIGVFGFVAGGILSIIVADKYERKYQISIAALLMGMAFIFRGLLIHDYLGLIVTGFVAFLSSSWLTASLLTYTSENFPTQIRSWASGVVEGIGNGIASFGPFIFILFHSFGFFNAMMGLALFSISSAGMIMFFGRDTAGKSLEELSN